MASGLFGGLDVVGLHRRGGTVSQQGEHAQNAVERRADFMAHIGEKHAFRHAAGFGLHPRQLQYVGQFFQLVTPPLQLPQLPDHDSGEAEDQRPFKGHQPIADHDVLLHAFVARVHLLRHALIGHQRQVVQRPAQQVQFGVQPSQAVQFQHRAGLAAEIGVGLADEGVQLGTGLLVFLGAVQQAGVQTVIHHSHPADKDVVALLQLGPVLLVVQHVFYRRLQPHGLGFELEVGPYDVVALVTRRGVQHVRLPHLNVSHSGEHAGQRSPDQDQATPGGMAALRRIHRAQCTSRDLSCQAERL